jgi:hypothetical protein
LVKQDKQILKLIKSKKNRRKKLANLPIEEKFKILHQMQKLVAPILKSRGIFKEPWIIGAELKQIEGYINTVRDPGLVDIDIKNDAYMFGVGSEYVNYSKDNDEDGGVDRWRELQ